MNCTRCNKKTCRTGVPCGNEKFDIETVTEQFLSPENQKIVQAAAQLVDNGRAGTLSRLEEIIEFIKTMQYQKVGLAYCYGMEQYASVVRDIFKKEGILLQTVSCSLGAILQDAINVNSCIHKISCNPIGQAFQLNAENVDFVIIMGICLGHDILLQKNLQADFTTFIVKDRTHKNNPMESLQKITPNN
jgi:uncharacterized metal-binding protein